MRKWRVYSKLEAENRIKNQVMIKNTQKNQTRPYNNNDFYKQQCKDKLKNKTKGKVRTAPLRVTGKQLEKGHRKCAGCSGGLCDMSRHCRDTPVSCQGTQPLVENTLPQGRGLKSRLTASVFF